MVLFQKLKEYLAARECVAFVGAGFSMVGGMPGWGGLIEGLLREAEKSVTTADQAVLLGDCRTAHEAGLYSTAASGIRQLLGKQEVRRHLVDAFASTRLQNVQDHDRVRMLSRLENLVLGPWVGILTTNYDTLIESSFDRYPQTMAPFRCDGSQDALGNVLCLPLGMNKFFVKLHGDTWADTTVLSTSDYIQTWITSPRMRHFLTAVMLRYRLVFIGCSLEDEILRLRQGLWAAFGRYLPKAYALLPDTPHNRLRRRELSDEAGIDSLLYPLDDSVQQTHTAVDEFLLEARKSADFRPQDTSDHVLSSLRLQEVATKINAVGEINRHLLTILSRQPNGRLKWSSMFDPHFDLIRQGRGRHILSTISESERLYRILFLVSLGLVEEVKCDGTQCFQIRADIADHLRHHK